MFKESITVLAVVAGLVATTAQARDGSERMQERFSQIDVNSDGQITPEEMQAQAIARFTAADTDGDGALTAQEMAAAAQGKRKERLLKRFDKDGDGSISGAELDAVGEGKMGKRFDRIDADNNGSVTLEEMQARRDPAKMMAKLDTDNSGGLSMEEFAKARGHGKHGKHGKHKMKRDAD